MDSSDDDPLGFTTKKTTEIKIEKKQSTGYSQKYNNLFGEVETKRENPFINTCDEQKFKDRIIEKKATEPEIQEEIIVTPEKTQKEPKKINLTDLANSDLPGENDLKLPEKSNIEEISGLKSKTLTLQPGGQNDVRIQKNPSPARGLRDGANKLLHVSNFL